jgi:hypothetical protein
MPSVGVAEDSATTTSQSLPMARKMARNTIPRIQSFEYDNIIRLREPKYSLVFAIGMLKRIKDEWLTYLLRQDQ